MDFLETTVHSSVHILRLERSVCLCASVNFKTVIMPMVVYSLQKVRFLNNYQYKGQSIVEVHIYSIISQIRLINILNKERKIHFLIYK